MNIRVRNSTVNGLYKDDKHKYNCLMQQSV